MMFGRFARQRATTLFLALALIVIGALASGARAEHALAEIAKLQREDLQTDDSFGAYMNSEGDLIAIGAPGQSRNGVEGSGAVYLYRVLNGEPVFEAELFPEGVNARFLGVRVEFDGDRVLIRSDDYYVLFERKGGAWEQTETFEITIDGGFFTYTLSRALMNDGVITLVGAITSFDDNTIVIRSYREIEGAWTEQGTQMFVTDSYAATTGYECDASGDSIIIGDVYYTTLGQVRHGAVYVLRRVSAPSDERGDLFWTHTQTLTPQDYLLNDEFGSNLDVSGEWLIVGSWRTDGSDIRAGAAYVYRDNGEEWVFHQKLVDPVGRRGDQFGWEVAIDGEYALVGAPSGDGPNGEVWGTAQMYKFDGSLWQPIGQLRASDPQFLDRFGVEVVTARGLAFVTAEDADTGELDTGAVYVFTTCGGDLNNDGVIDTADLGAMLRAFGKPVVRMDFNRDGVVGLEDLATLLSEFGSRCP